MTMLASRPIIGTAVSDGAFTIDQAHISGTATLFEGAVIETEQAARLEMKSAWMHLGSGSRVRVSRQSAVLERGLGEVGSPAGYRLEALTLQIVGGTPKAIARVQLDGDKVLVTAVSGPVRVSNAAGLLVASVHPGAALAFEPNVAQQNTFDIHGCLVAKDGKYIVVDQGTGQAVEVTGRDFSTFAGYPVHMTGKSAAGTPVAGASQIVVVDSLEKTGESGCPVAQGPQPGRSGGVAPGTGPGRPAKPAGGAAHASHTGIYAGVGVAAAAAAGVGIALGTRGSKSP